MPKPNIIQVYATRIEEQWPEGEFDRLMKIIPADLQERVMKESGWENQYGSLARKLMLWHGMKEMGHDIDHLFEDLQFSKTGKPYIAGAPHFSLANDGAVAVCALSETSILGIDLERLKPINLTDYREKMTFLEWREIYSHVIPLRRFYEFWTIKESVIKADGELEFNDLKEIYIQPDVAFCNAKYWYINPVEIEYYGYLSFMVCSSPHAEIEITEVDLPSLF